MKFSVNLLIACFIATIFAFVFAVPDHLIDHSWPIHAQNHVLQALIWIVGYCLVGITIVLFPFKKGEHWAWWSLLVTGLFIYGGYFLSIFITGGGAPGMRDDIFFVVIIICYLFALINAKKNMN